MNRHRQYGSVVASVREACGRVAAAARQVRVEFELIPLYAASLPEPPHDPGPDAPQHPSHAPNHPPPQDQPHHPPHDQAHDPPQDREALAAFWLTLDAINFGSGWFPTLHKRPGRSGYFTISEGLRRRFDRQGPWSAAELTQVTQAELARRLGQDPEHELMGLFARSLRDLGERIDTGYGGSFLGPVEEASGSAVALVQRLAGWECFADTSAYAGETVPFLKRAQLAAADLHRAVVARFGDLDELTMFADNLVPHVLRLDGILTFAPELVARIEREELIEHGSAEEVEIRACAVHAVEMIVAASPVATNAATVDQLLWHRGQLRPYKASPRHRSRCTAY